MAAIHPCISLHIVNQTTNMYIASGIGDPNPRSGSTVKWDKCLLTIRKSCPIQDLVYPTNHQLHDCFLNHLCRRRSKKTSKLPVTGVCAGIPWGPVNSPHKWPVTRIFFHLMTSSCSANGLWVSSQRRPPNMFIARARASFKFNTGVAITTYSFQMGCHLYSVASSPSLKLCFWAHPLWLGTNVLGNWQKVMLPQSEYCEINPRQYRGSSVWVICVFLCQSITNNPIYIYIYIYIYVCVCVCARIVVFILYMIIMYVFYI